MGGFSLAQLDPEQQPQAAQPEPPLSPDMGGQAPSGAEAPKKQGGLKAKLGEMFQNALSATHDSLRVSAGLPTEDAIRKGAIDNQHTQALTEMARTQSQQMMQNAEEVPYMHPITGEVLRDAFGNVQKGKAAQVKMWQAGQTKKYEMDNKPPTANSDKDRYMGLQTKINLGQALTPDEKAWSDAYEKTTTLSPVAGAKARAEGFGGIKIKTLYDTKTRSMRPMNANEWNAANTAEPGRFIEPGTSPEWISTAAKTKGMANLATQVMQVSDGNGGTTTTTKLDALQNRLSGVSNLNFERILNKSVQMDDVVGAFNEVKKYTHVLNNGHNGAIAAAVADPEHTLTQYAQSGVIGNLTPDEQTYVVTLLMARETAGSLRQILGTGQSSDMNRRLIMATLPGANTPDSQYADKQMDAALGIINRLKPSVPKNVVSRPSVPKALSDRKNPKAPAATHRFNPATNSIEVISEGAR